MTVVVPRDDVEHVRQARAGDLDQVLTNVLESYTRDPWVDHKSLRRELPEIGEMIDRRTGWMAQLDGDGDATLTMPRCELVGLANDLIPDRG